MLVLNAFRNISKDTFVLGGVNDGFKIVTVVRIPPPIHPLFFEISNPCNKYLFASREACWL
jgi:hypothetical protein